MRVIQHQSGWDIALDMVFKDKHTAHVIAGRIQYAVHALVRGAVDQSMCERKAHKDANEETFANLSSSPTRTHAEV